MLKKEFRLKKESAFQATYRIRNSYCQDGIVLWIGKKKTDSKFPTKVGFVVSKKTHKRSVRRNRLKRLMRESYRLLQKEDKIANAQQYMSLIFAGYEKALGKDFPHIQTTILSLLEKIKN